MRGDKVNHVSGITNPHFKPVIQPPCRVNLSAEADVEEKLKEILSEGIIEKVDTKECHGV